MMLSIVHKLSLATVLLVLVSAGVVGGLFYSKTTDLLVERTLEDIAGEVQDAGSMLRTIISTHDEDVLFLANTPPIQGMLRTRSGKATDHQDKSSYAQWVSRLETIFKSQLQRKSTYLSIRYIDKHGEELVHVSRQGLEIVSLSGELQNKAPRAYVRETLKLPSGLVYVSEMNLNREHGELKLPHQEVIRSATPVYDEKNGGLAGLVVITIEVGDKLRAIQDRISSRSNDEIYITNDRGGYLLHPDSNKAYGFDLGKRYRIQEDIPQLAKLFLPDSQVSQVTLMPEDTDGQQVVNFTKIPFDPANPLRFIAVIIAHDYASIVAEQSGVLNDVAMWASVLILGGAGLGLVFSIRFTRPIKLMTRALDDFAHQRPTAASLPVEQGDEIGVLARTFEFMSHQVAETQNNLREANNKLERLVSERTGSLRDSEARQRTILEAIADAIITIDDKGLIQSFNPAAEAIFSYRADEVMGQNVSILLPVDEQQAHQGYTKHSTLHAPRIISMARELEGRRKDGSLFPLELNVAPIPGEGRRGFVGILRDITERKRVDKMKNEFISTVSHELRTPLTSIRGSLGLMAGGAVGELPEQAQEMLKIAGNNTERLLLLINDILDIQKIESGEMVFKFQSLAIMPFLERVLEENAAYGEQYGVEFVIASELANAQVFADKDRLMQVMANLLSNAAKFSPEGEKVEISVAQHHDDTLRISVTDHGLGIPEDFQPKLFDKFTQSDSSDTRQKGGTGLGLNITKAIVEKHGGHIDFFSRVGVGTTFYIELPELIGDIAVNKRANLRRPPDKHLPCILIVERDPDVAVLMKRVLAEAGYNSDIACDANAARQQLEKKAGQYKAITLDLVVPAEDGGSLLEDLRKEVATQDIPVVVVSVQADEAKRDLNGSAIGVVDWLQRPIDQRRLIKAVKQAAGPIRLSRVLHVEDEADVHKVVSAMLRDHCELTWTTTLAASKKALESDDFDLVLLDVALPDGSGLELLETIERRLTPPRVVIFSADGVTQEYADKVSAVLLKSEIDNFRLAEVINGVINHGTPS